jgi:hypothetical protein
LLLVGLLAVAPPVPVPQALCAVRADQLAELSGMVVDGPTVVATADGGRRVELHRLDGALDGDCAISDTRSVDINPYDVEDLARGPDGALWVADIGDNDRDRQTVAVIVVPAGGEPRLHRLTYPDGPHDAEALLVDQAGRPVVVTKEVGAAGVYRTAAVPDGVGPTPLERLGTLSLPPSDTPGGPVGTVGSRVVTGAALSADGSVVAVRTYTDAWLFPTSGGDPAMALTENPSPVRVPLPDEPQGEAIAFTPDGVLLSGSEARSGALGEIRSVPAAVMLATASTPASAPAATAGATDGGAPVAAGGDPAAAPAEPPPDWLPAALGGGAAVGLLVVAILAMTLRARRRR